MKRLSIWLNKNFVSTPIHKIWKNGFLLHQEKLEGRTTLSGEGAQNEALFERESSSLHRFMWFYQVGMTHRPKTLLLQILLGRQGQELDELLTCDHLIQDLGCPLQMTRRTDPLAKSRLALLCFLSHPLTP
jgi:hypothetical protein